MGAGASFTVGAAIKCKSSHLETKFNHLNKMNRCGALSNKITDGLGSVVVGVKDPDVIVNKTSHKRIFPEILNQNLTFK
jgi:nitrate reductase NapAB chaperone NapD